MSIPNSIDGGAYTDCASGAANSETEWEWECEKEAEGDANAEAEAEEDGTMRMSAIQRGGAMWSEGVKE